MADVSLKETAMGSFMATTTAIAPFSWSDTANKSSTEPVWESGMVITE